MIAPLPKLEARFDISFDLANAAAIEMAGAETRIDPESYHLRAEPGDDRPHR